MQDNTSPQKRTGIVYEVDWKTQSASIWSSLDGQGTSATEVVEEEILLDENTPTDDPSPSITGLVPSPSDEEFEFICDDEAFSAPIQSINSPPPPGKADHIPVVSQVKSIIHLAKGNEIAAKQTQENFSKGAIGVSQVRSLVELAKGDAEAAKETQEYFWNNSRLKNIDKMPILGHVKGGIHYLMGDKERGKNIMKDSTCSVMASSLVTGVGGAIRRRNSDQTVDNANSDTEIVDITPPNTTEESNSNISEITGCMAAMDMEEEEKYLEYNKCKLQFKSCYSPD